MTSPAPRSPLRLRLYAWVAGVLLGSLEGVLAVVVAGGAGRGAATAGLPGGGSGVEEATGGALGAANPAPAVPVALVLCAMVVVGALCGPRLSRLLGRRVADLGAGALIVAGALLAAALTGGEGPLGARTAGAVVAGLVGPAAAGAGAGLLLLVAPQVCHELSLPGHRRLMPQAMALMPAGAALVVLGGTLGARWLPDPARGAWLGVLVLGAVHLGVGISLPESPVWLAERGGDVRAFEALRRLHGNLEAAVAVDWARHEAGMAREQQRLTAADLRIPQIRQATVTSVVLVVAQEAPLGAAALVLAPAVADHLGGGARTVAAACVGWGVVSVLALLLGRVETLERLRFLRVVLGSVVAVVAATVLVTTTSAGGGGPSDADLPGGALAGTVVGCLVALVAGQYVLVLPACQGAVDPQIPPWLVGTQRRLVAVGQSLAHAGAIVVPLLVYQRWGLDVVGWVMFTLTVVALAVVLVRMPRALRAA
ncbi:MFS transporter [Actinomyces wuliandei]|nr:MFS transporter [Actinomyces wuliandei]